MDTIGLDTQMAMCFTTIIVYSGFALPLLLLLLLPG
jgi:hypothetical protein